MAVASFKNIHTSIKSKITAHSFVYADVSQWSEVDGDDYPRGLVNNSFNVQFSDLSASEYSDDVKALSVSVEFILEGKRDKYLDKMADCNNAMESVKTLTSADASDIAVVEKSGFEHFTSEVLGDMVRVTYNFIIYIQSRS